MTLTAWPSPQDARDLIAALVEAVTGEELPRELAVV